MAAGTCPMDVTADCPSGSGNYGYNNTGGCGNVGCNNHGECFPDCESSVSDMMLKGKRRKDFAFWRQFDEKPSIIPGCPVT